MNGQIGFEPEEVEATLNKLQYASDDIIGTGFTSSCLPYEGEVVGEAVVPFTNVLEWVSRSIGIFAEKAPVFLGYRAIDVRDTIRDLEELDQDFERELNHNLEWTREILGTADPDTSAPVTSAPPPAGAGGMPNTGSAGAAPAAAGGMPNAPAAGSGEGIN